jgi:hypothetical protein
VRRWASIGAAAGGIAAAAAVGVAVGTARWHRETARAVGLLGGAERAPDGKETVFTREMLDGLPAPVARYFQFALAPGQRLIRRARVEHAGTFAARPGRWAPFASVQQVAVRPPGFVWDAAIRVGPGVQVRVRDSYLRGDGSMQAAAAALVTVVDQRGTPEMASASLMRYLAEAPWFPTALLPVEGVEWRTVDDSTARATLADAGTSVTVDFHFGAGGEIVRVSADRYRDVGGTPVLTPWVGRSWDYERRHGMMIPTAGDVQWVTPGGSLPYWRARVVAVEYELAR